MNLVRLTSSPPSAGSLDSSHSRSNPEAGTSRVVKVRPGPAVTFHCRREPSAIAGTAGCASSDSTAQPTPPLLSLTPLLRSTPSGSGVRSVTSGDGQGPGGSEHAAAQRLRSHLLRRRHHSLSAFLNVTSVRAAGLASGFRERPEERGEGVARVRPRQPVASPSRRENAERREGRAARAEPAWRGGGQRAAPPLRKLRAVPSGREAQARPSAAGCRRRRHRTTWTRSGGRRRRAAVAPTALPRARSPPTSGRWSEARPAVALPRCAAGARGRRRRRLARPAFLLPRTGSSRARPGGRCAHTATGPGDARPDPDYRGAAPGRPCCSLPPPPPLPSPFPAGDMARV